MSIGACRVNPYAFAAQIQEQWLPTASAWVITPPEPTRAMRMPGTRGVFAASPAAPAREQMTKPRLIQRSSLRFVVKEIGAEFHRHALAMLVETDAAESVVRRRTAEPCGTIRFTCSVSFARLALADLIPRLMATYPRVRIVQHATNRFVDLVQEGFDLCLRAHTDPLPDSSLVRRAIARIPWHLFAGPSYPARNGTPSKPDELSAHDGIALGVGLESYAWRLRDARPGAEVVALPFAPSLVSDDMATLKAAACAGLGIVALPGFVGTAEVTQGQLVRVLPHWLAGLATMSVLIPSRRGRLPAVSAFVDFLAEHVPAAVQ
ncbi:substrate binding domain-containing protein [Dyella soli]|uniref:LysR family transcriptional regulator n=1 Tax=Dyella soli TaxID=522319 RepID=A0A4R0YUG1_9GAMM|nr:substrate binding domain-containing protein [Dyella soli]TCI10563.1 LysR family transcriptional regulator [Dyella soli]